MKRDLSRRRQEIRRLESSREVHLNRILDEEGPLRRGSFVSLRRKCGKPNCHCATGEGHPAYYLSVKEGGRTRMVYIPGSEARSVAEEARRYRRFRRERAALAKLCRQTLEAIDRLEETLERTGEVVERKGKGQRRRGKRPGKKS